MATIINDINFITWHIFLLFCLGFCFNFFSFVLFSFVGFFLFSFSFFFFLQLTFWIHRNSIHFMTG